MQRKERKAYQRHPKEVKDLVLTGARVGVAVRELSQIYNVPTGTIYHWIRLKYGGMRYLRALISAEESISYLASIKPKINTTIHCPSRCHVDEIMTYLQSPKISSGVKDVMLKACHLEKLISQLIKELEDDGLDSKRLYLLDLYGLALPIIVEPGAEDKVGSKCKKVGNLGTALRELLKAARQLAAAFKGKLSSYAENIGWWEYIASHIAKFRRKATKFLQRFGWAGFISRHSGRVALDVSEFLSDPARAEYLNNIAMVIATIAVPVTAADPVAGAFLWLLVFILLPIKPMSKRRAGLALAGN